MNEITLDNIINEFKMFRLLSVVYTTKILWIKSNKMF